MPVHPLTRAAARLRELAGRPVVVKLGGSALDEPAAATAMLDALADLHVLGVRLAVVHGGGKAIDRGMAAAGLTPVKVQGRRYTDAATLRIVVETLLATASELRQRLDEQGVPARRIDPFPVHGERLLLPGLDLSPVDLGHVGRPTRVEVGRLTGVPVLPSLAVGPDGGWLNVNADTAAAAVAGALGAAACLFLTDTPGVLRSVTDPGSLLPRLTRCEADALVRDGTVGGGMVPKLEACFEALDAGAGSAVILDGRNPHALLDWLVGEPAGTEIVP